MRPVNLIPLDQRRGAARGGSRKSPLPLYIGLGALGAGVLCLLALTLTGNQINDKTGQVAELKAKQASAKSVADALRPFGQFATIQQAREAQIEQVVQNRFDWEHVVDQLARTTPANVWLLGVSGTVSPEVQVESAGGGTGLREDAPGPALTLVGCTYSHRSVARMMARMNNIDGVTDVKLAKSVKRDDDGGAVSAPAGPSAEEQQDCIGSSRVAKFELMVAFGASQTGAPAAAGVPQGSAAQLAKADGAAAAAAPGGGP